MLQKSLDALFSKYCGTVKLVNVKYTGVDQNMEAVYHVSLKKEKFMDPLVKDMSHEPGVIYVNVFYDEDDINPPTI